MIGNGSTGEVVTVYVQRLRQRLRGSSSVIIVVGATIFTSGACKSTEMRLSLAQAVKLFSYIFNSEVVPGYFLLILKVKHCFSAFPGMEASMYMHDKRMQ